MIRMETFEKTSFLEVAVFSALVKDEKKLVITTDEVNTLRSLQEQLNEFQRKLCQDALVS